MTKHCTCPKCRTRNAEPELNAAAAAVRIRERVSFVNGNGFVIDGHIVARRGTQVKVEWTEMGMTASAWMPADRTFKD